MENRSDVERPSLGWLHGFGRSPKTADCNSESTVNYGRMNFLRRNIRITDVTSARALIARAIVCCSRRRDDATDRVSKTRSRKNVRVAREARINWIFDFEFNFKHVSYLRRNVGQIIRKDCSSFFTSCSAANQTPRLTASFDRRNINLRHSDTLNLNGCITRDASFDIMRLRRCRVL